MGKRKGCFNCSKRRIKCDLTEPHCMKCTKKNLECPGMGIRYRFSPGIASRGKFRGCRIPLVKEKPTEKGPLVEQTSLSDSYSRSNAATAELGEDFGVIGYLSGLATDHRAQTKTDDPAITPVQWQSTSVLPEIQILDSSTEMLFSHFSNHVAPVMVALDSEFNGYRRVFLPLAYHDAQVRRAVCIVSALHLRKKIPGLRESVDTVRVAVIVNLRRLVDDEDWAQILSTSNWATIILLLVGEMISGGDDFSYLLKMLLSLVEARGKLDSDDNSDVYSFLIQQTRMIELFGRPFLGESEGIQAVSQGAEFYCDFISHTLRYYPDYTRQFTVSVLMAAVSQAANIYLGRALATSSHSINDGITIDSHSETMDLGITSSLELLKTLVAEIHADSPGSHTLVWVYFIGAAESRTEEDRLFFTSRLMDLYWVIGFDNIVIGIDTLDKLWSTQGSERWTERLPSVSPLVM